MRRRKKQKSSVELKILATLDYGFLLPRFFLLFLFSPFLTCSHKSPAPEPINYNGMAHKDSVTSHKDKSKSLHKTKDVLV